MGNKRTGMNRERTMKWLDDLIKRNDAWKRVCKGPAKGYEACNTCSDGIQLFDCIAKIAETLEIPFEFNVREDGWSYGEFMYKNKRFFELHMPGENKNG